jgi:hypothetical protein
MPRGNLTHFRRDPQESRLELEALLDAHEDPAGHIALYRQRLLTEVSPREARSLLAIRKLYAAIPQILDNVRQPCSVAGCSHLRSFTSEYCSKHAQHDLSHGDPLRAFVRHSELAEIRMEVRRFIAANAGHPAISHAASAANAWVTDPHPRAKADISPSAAKYREFMDRMRAAQVKPSDVLCTVTARLVHALREEVTEESLAHLDQFTRYGATEIGRGLMRLAPPAPGKEPTGHLRRLIANSLPELVRLACIRLAEGVEQDRKLASNSTALVQAWVPFKSASLGIALNE